eukprot:TRINITY_DN6751_c0_g1_i1.p1 TRINITY_DN6751_c0_g1~~TRINITY_DN6751_c0_g1_i1.p1  ORF type:complete len:444 (-),score=82.32 TRINITY_DN6751_c0_g1_i1:121-1452(-)
MPVVRVAHSWRILFVCSKPQPQPRRRKNSKNLRLLQKTVSGSKMDDSHSHSSPRGTPRQSRPPTKEEYSPRMSHPNHGHGIQDAPDVSPESFEKIKLIGKGDVGKVYLVRHSQTGQMYAMKVLDKKEMIKRHKVKRVLTERDILISAEHPFIVTLYWSFQSPSRLYFVMDYCAGGEFFRTLQKQPGKCLPEDAVRFYAAEVLLALEYLHLMGFVYRDLKPENILLHESGHIMLTDFDLSAQAVMVVPQFYKKTFKPDDFFFEPQIKSNSFVGTAEYIAPEVIKGDDQTSSLDWWTFGIFIYEMTFGHTPFRGKSQDDTFTHILDGDLDFPHENSFPVSSACKSIIKKLLHHDARKRLGSHHGAIDIKNHRFFDKINFSLIRNMTPPIIPHIESALDTSNFRNLKDEDAKETEIATSSPKETNSKENPFEEFTPISKPPHGARF